LKTNDYCAIPQQLRDQLGERYPEARRAYLKTGGDFPFLSRPDEDNLHLQLHLRRVDVEARPDLVHNVPKGDIGGSPGKENNRDGSDKSHKDDKGGSENPPAKYEINPTSPESSGSGNLDKQTLDSSERFHLDHELTLYAFPGGFTR
ncbi:Maspardin, partial [Glycine soja]